MSHSVCSDLTYIQGGGCCCNGGTPPVIYRSVWDRLCQQLFGQIPPGMDSENILPDIKIWKDGVTMQSDEEGNYTFTVTTDDGTTPKPDDVILYKDKFYVIGVVTR